MLTVWRLYYFTINNKILDYIKYFIEEKILIKLFHFVIHGCNHGHLSTKPTENDKNVVEIIIGLDTAPQHTYCCANEARISSTFDG